MAGRRPREAWQQTTRTWKTELAYGCVGGLFSLGFLAATGWPESKAVTATVPLFSAISAAILVPLAQFLWRLLWQPWNDMRDQIAGLASGDDSPTASQQPAVNPQALKGLALAQIGEELEAAQDVLTGPRTDRFFVRHDLATGKWATHGPVIAVVDPALHKKLRAAYRAMDAVNNRGVQRNVVTSRGEPTTLLNPDLTEPAREAIKEAIEALEEGSG